MNFSFQFPRGILLWLGITLPFFLVIMAVVIYVSLASLPAAQAPVDDPEIIVIKTGMSTQSIGELLHNKGLIRSVFYFQSIAKMDGFENKLQAGEYTLQPNMTVREILAAIARGDTAYKRLTIPEGFTIQQIAALLAEKKMADAGKLKNLAKDFAPYDYMTDAPGLIYRAEGYLFPDTYQVPKGLREEQILRMMARQFDTQLTAAMRAKAGEMGMSVKELVILASLVEKEARLEQDRPLIASVFLNRLRQGMPLQSCATIQYILGYPKAELTIQDTTIPSPYNTYQNMGLPPGPIANPGIASIKAVLNAADTDYLFFVADAQGAHHFSRTYQEHLMAISQVN